MFRDQPHAVHITLKADALAVIFDFVEPLRASRQALARQAKLEMRPRSEFRPDFSNPMRLIFEDGIGQ